jgi:hypothetical protein
LSAPRPAQTGQGLAQDVGQRLARALAGHLDEAELREAVHGDARAVARERLAEFRQHGIPVLGGVHVDEVDDDDAAEIPQPQLPGDRLRRLEVGLEDGVVEGAPRDEAAGVDVDGGERLGLVDDDVAAAFQVHAPGERALDLVLDGKQVEERALAGVMLEDRQRLPRVALGELAQSAGRSRASPR